MSFEHRGHTIVLQSQVLSHALRNAVRVLADVHGNRQPGAQTQPLIVEVKANGARPWAVKLDVPVAVGSFESTNVTSPPEAIDAALPGQTASDKRPSVCDADLSKLGHADAAEFLVPTELRPCVNGSSHPALLPGARIGQLDAIYRTFICAVIDIRPCLEEPCG